MNMPRYRNGQFATWFTLTELRGTVAGMYDGSARYINKNEIFPDIVYEATANNDDPTRWGYPTSFMNDAEQYSPLNRWLFKYATVDGR